MKTADPHPIELALAVGPVQGHGAGLHLRQQVRSGALDAGGLLNGARAGADGLGGLGGGSAFLLGRWWFYRFPYRYGNRSGLFRPAIATRLPLPFPRRWLLSWSTSLTAS